MHKHYLVRLHYHPHTYRLVNVELLTFDNANRITLVKYYNPNDSNHVTKVKIIDFSPKEKHLAYVLYDSVFESIRHDGVKRVN